MLVPRRVGACRQVCNLMASLSFVNSSCIPDSQETCRKNKGRFRKMVKKMWFSRNIESIGTRMNTLKPLPSIFVHERLSSRATEQGFSTASRITNIKYPTRGNRQYSATAIWLDEKIEKMSKKVATKINGHDTISTAWFTGVGFHDASL